MRSFMVDRIKDIGVAAANKITGELGLVVIGARAPSDAIGQVTAILGEPSRSRATAIVRTEVGRAFSVATQEKMAADAKILPGLQKQWRRSGKAHPRLHHDLADGQVVEVNQPFILHPPGKAQVKLMFPRDPAAPVGEVVNCGCVSLPWMAHWKVAHPGRKPGGVVDEGKPLAEILDKPAAARLAAPRVRLTLRDIERRDFIGEREQGAIVSASGDVLWRGTGTRDSLTIPADKVGLLRGAILTHSHGEGAVSSFSVEDVVEAARHGVMELRAIDAFNHYSLRPPAGGWSAAFAAEQPAQLAARLEREIEAQWTPHLAAGRISQAEYDAYFWDELWKRASKETGLRYRRTPRRTLR